MFYVVNHTKWACFYFVGPYYVYFIKLQDRVLLTNKCQREFDLVVSECTMSLVVGVQSPTP